MIVQKCSQDHAASDRKKIIQKMYFCLRYNKITAKIGPNCANKHLFSMTYLGYYKTQLTPKSYMGLFSFKFSSMNYHTTSEINVKDTIGYHCNEIS